MGWWGKLLGGGFGFILGGPLGAVLGAALGHNFDRGLKVALQDGRVAGMHSGDPERIQTAFFTTTFSVMGYIAKADGRVSAQEIALAEQVMAHMSLNAEQRRAAVELFNQGKQADFPIDEVLQQFHHECGRRSTLIQMFLEILVATALGDGVLHKAERSALYRICEALDYPTKKFDRLIQMVQAQQHYAGGAAQAPKATLKDAYAVLGISRDATMDEVKRAYRRLTNQHHPDKLVAKGLPEEMLELAKEKTQEIRAAYEQIRKSKA